MPQVSEPRESNKTIKEKQMLGKLIARKKLYSEVFDYAQEFGFQTPREAMTFYAIKQLHDVGRILSLSTVYGQLEKMGAIRDKEEVKKYLLSLLELAVGFVRAEWSEEPGETSGEENPSP